MANNDFADLEELVRRDIQAGLASERKDAPAPFAALQTEHSDENGVLYANAITGGALTAIEWAFQCRHVAPFGGIPATGRDLTIYGVTIVRVRGGATTFRRYVDWSAVMVDLGVTASFRPAYERIDEIPNIRVNRERSAPTRARGKRRTNN